MTDRQQAEDLAAKALLDWRAKVYAEAIRGASNYDPVKHERYIEEQEALARRLPITGDIDCARAILDAIHYDEMAAVVEAAREIEQTVTRSDSSFDVALEKLTVAVWRWDRALDA
jgi:hypothetical protein